MWVIGVILAFLLRDKERGSVSENQKMKKIPVLKSLGMLFSNVFSGLSYFISVYRAPRDGRQRTGYRLFSLTAYLLIFR